MKKTVLFIAIFMVTGITSAQINLTGVVKDSIGDPLEMASILAINKETNKMTSYGFTDANGNYKLRLGENGTFSVKVSYVGMKSSDVEVLTKESDLVKNVILTYDNLLDEINIISKMPVTISGDTIIYNADSFKNGSERKLEDVLKKIPGMEVNEDGEIEIEGKKVGKVMVEGKEFFDGDTKVATKNIPADAIDKIQVLKNYGEVSQLRGVQNNQDNIAINIKLKKGKKNFWFGDVTAGGGVAKDKILHVLQPKLFYYSPKYSINFIGDLNNIGETGLTRRDLRNFSGGGFGGGAPSSSSGTSINLGSNDIGFLAAQNNRAKDINTKFGATNFSYAPNKKLDLSGFAIFSSSRIEQLENRNSIYTEVQDDPSTPEIERTPDDEMTSSDTNQKTDLGLFKLSAVYKPNVNNQLDYDIFSRFSKDSQSENFFSSNLGNIDTFQETTPYSINQTLNFYHTLNERNIFAFNVQTLYQDEDPFYNAILADKSTYTNTANALGLENSQISYQVNQEKRVKTNQLDAKLDYWNVINTKSNINLTLGTIYSKQNFDSNLFQTLDNGANFDPTPTMNDGLHTNEIEYIFTDTYLGVHYQFIRGKFTFRPGLSAHAYRTENDQFGAITTDEFFRVLPDFNLRLALKQSENITFNYQMQTTFTDVNQFAKGLVLNNYNAIFQGNPDLEAALAHNLSISYFSFNMFNYTNVISRLSYNKRVDQVQSNAKFLPGSVVSVRIPDNSDFANESLNFFGRFQKTYTKYRASLNTVFNYSKFIQAINGRQTTNENYLQSYTGEFGTNFRKAPNVTLKYNYRIQDNHQGSRRTKFFTKAPSIDFDAYLWEKLTFRTGYSYTSFSNTEMTLQSFDVWDASLIYRFNKESKWEYQLKASNILDTRSQTNTNSNDFSVNTTQYFIQPRFLTFRVIYSI
jgi:hypothetical protein